MFGISSGCCLVCLAKLVESEKHFLHFKHGTDKVVSWVFRPLDCVKTFSQWLHWNKLSPVWMTMWLFRLDGNLKANLHCEQGYGLSPVWVIMWVFKLPAWEKPFLQLGHWNIFNLSAASVFNIVNVTDMSICNDSRFVWKIVRVKVWRGWILCKVAK